MTVLVGVDRTTGALFSTPCPRKGAVPYVARAVAEFIRRLKSENANVQTDNEDSIMNLMMAVQSETPDLRIKFQTEKSGGQQCEQWSG